MAQSTKWCFTIHNYSQETIDRLQWVAQNLSECKARGIGFQEEVAPTTGAKHIQGFVRMERGVRMAAIKKLLQRDDAHLEIMRGTLDQNIAYVTKDETAVNGGVRTVTGDNSDNQGKRNDITELAAKIKAKEMTLRDVMDQCPQLYCQYKNGIRDLCDAAYGAPRCEKSHVTVMYGASGTGKSMEAFKSEDYYVLRSSKTGVWFDGYNYNKTLIIDDFYGWIPFNMLLNLLDRYSMKVDIKGGAMEFNSPKIIITSNSSPLNWYKNLSIEHQIALLRRLDCVQCFTRNQGIVDVTKAIQMKINDLTKLCCESEEDELLEMVNNRTEPVVETPVSNDQTTAGEVHDSTLCVVSEVPQGNTILEVTHSGQASSDNLKSETHKKIVRISEFFTLGRDYDSAHKCSIPEGFVKLSLKGEPIYIGPGRGEYEYLKSIITKDLCTGIAATP